MSSYTEDRNPVLGSLRLFRHFDRCVSDHTSYYCAPIVSSYTEEVAYRAFFLRLWSSMVTKTKPRRPTVLESFTLALA